MSKLQVVRREERNAVQSFLDVRNFFLVRANLQLKLYATEQKERPTMDLSQITNTDITFSLATMEDILARYNAQTEGMKFANSAPEPQGRASRGQIPPTGTALTHSPAAHTLPQPRRRGRAWASHPRLSRPTVLFASNQQPTHSHVDSCR